METKPLPHAEANAEQPKPRDPWRRASLALRVATGLVLWTYTVAAVLVLVLDDAPVVSVGVHALLTLGLCGVSAGAAAVAWMRFRRDGTSRSLILCLSFLALASFYGPHLLLAAQGEDQAHRLLGGLARLLFPLGLLAVAVRVGVPESLMRRAGVLVPIVVVLPFALDAAMHLDEVARVVPVQSDGLRYRVEQLTLATQLIATGWVTSLWWRERQPFLLVLACAIGVLASSSALLLWTEAWTPRWWAAHIGSLGCAMLLLAGLAGERLRRGSLLGAFDLNAASRLAAIVEGSDEVIYSFATSGTIDSWNPAAERVLGFSADEAVGHPPGMLVPEDLVEVNRDLLERVMHGETFHHVEAVRRRKGGGTVEMELTVSPIRAPTGQVVGASVIGHSIEDRRRAEQLARQAIAELERADELKSQFLAMASHELRTPLTSITGFTSTLLGMGDQLPARQREEFLRIIDQQADRLNRLVGDLLTLSRIEAAKLQTRTVPVMVRSLVERTAAELDATVRIDCDERLIVVADEDHVQQIIINYLSNAMKYGAPPISVSARRSGETVEIRVCDEGPGVPPEYRDRLFERFARVPHEDAGRDVPSTGLGLSIVRGLARANAGEAWFEPHGSLGSCFCVRLPTVAPRAPGGASG